MCGNFAPKQIKIEIKFSRDYREDSLVDVINHQNEISFLVMKFWASAVQQQHMKAQISTGKPKTTNVVVCKWKSFQADQPDQKLLSTEKNCLKTVFLKIDFPNEPPFAN